MRSATLYSSSSMAYSATDIEEIDTEFREAIIGMTVAWKLLYVVYTIRNEERFRIISARPVTKGERKKYEEY